MPDELLPVKQSPFGSVIYEYLEYFPASLLAKMNLGGLPGSRVGIYDLADKEKWEYILVPGKGKKDGVRYYRVPDYVHVLIDYYRESLKRSFDNKNASLQAELDHNSDPSNENLMSFGQGKGRVASVPVRQPVPSHVAAPAAHYGSLDPARLRLALALTDEAASVQSLSMDQRADMALAFYMRLENKQSKGE